MNPTMLPRASGTVTAVIGSRRGETGGGHGGKAVERQRQADAEGKGHGGHDRQGSKDIGAARGVHRRT